MKYILFILLLISSIHANYIIKCPKDITYTTGSGNLGVDYFYYDGEKDTPLESWTNVFFEAFDSQSAVCGGSLNKNILLQFYCDYDSGICFDHIKTSSLNGLHFITNTTNKDGNIITGSFTNKTIIVNNIPCVDSSIILPVNIVHTYYNDDTTEKNLEYDFMGFQITGIFSQSETILDEDTAKEYRKACNKTDIVEYVDDLEPQRFQMPSLITSLNNFFDSDISFFNNINTESEDYSSINEPTQTDITSDLDSFSNDYENTLNDTFLNYSDVFGFGGYAPAPNNITFELLGNKYVVFGESLFNPYIDEIRNTLLIFSYVWGVLIVIKDLKNV